MAFVLRENIPVATIIYILTKAPQKEPLNIKGIKDPHSPQPIRKLHLNIDSSKICFLKAKKKIFFFKEQLKAVTLFQNLTHPPFSRKGMFWGGLSEGYIEYI